MRTEGIFTPESLDEAQEAYEDIGPVAQTVVREVAKAMNFDREEYRERVDSDVVHAAHNTIFASFLRVYVGSTADFDAWCADNPEYEVHTIGSEQVSQVVWHPSPMDDLVVAATFEEEAEAAIATLRRQAFNRIYREEL